MKPEKNKNPEIKNEHELTSFECSPPEQPMAGKKDQHSTLSGVITQRDSIDVNSKAVGDNSVDVLTIPIETKSLSETSQSDSDYAPSVQIVDLHVIPEPDPTVPTSGRISWEIAKLLLVPLTLLVTVAAALAMVGMAQRLGWIVADSSVSSEKASATTDESNVSYICPMMCVPPTSQPGRCPVCAMELVPAAAGSSSGPSTTIEIDPRSRRVAGIKTVRAELQILHREIRGVGEIQYDESKLKTLSAYVDGRIEHLYADFTGVTVNQGDVLALLSSPELYAGQVEFTRTLEFLEKAVADKRNVDEATNRLLDSARERLVELGMTEEQLEELAQSKSPSRRLHLHAPISGTVIEKLAVTGQYIQSGSPIYRLADLGSVWLVLEVFPDDAKSIRIGQSVTATTQSMGAQEFEGVVEFIEPTVDPVMRTVGVRIAIENQHGHLKPGEFARAKINVPVAAEDGQPRQTVVVPRNSLLSVGETSLLYVEERPGEFKLRNVTTGPGVDGLVAVFNGVDPGDNVVAQSTFLLDAQMQLQGNPSLIDPNKAVKEQDASMTQAEQDEIRNALAPLSEDDRRIAEAQVICPVTEARLGSLGMGTPIKMEVDGRPVFICCEGCRQRLLESPDKFWNVLKDYQSRKSNESTQDEPHNGHHSGDQLPQLDLPQMQAPPENLPQLELPKMQLPESKSGGN